MQVDEEIERRAGRITPTYVWEMMRTNTDFTLSLWMSETSAYCAVYFGYEDFLIRCLKIATNRASLRPPSLFGVLRDTVGVSAAKECWKSEGIERARLVRAAVVHNGRRMTGDLQRFRSDVLTEGGEIVILPGHTTAVFQLLKESAMKFSERLLAVQR